MIKPILKLLFINRLKVIKGLEHIPSSGPFLLCGNHNSYLDGIIINSVVLNKINQRVNFLTEFSVWQAWHKLKLDKYLGMILVNPAKKAESLDVALAGLKNRKIICIFPEGQRMKEKNLRQGKTGTSRLALWSKVSVIPFGITTTFDWTIPQAMGNYFNFKHKITLTFGPPLDLSEYYSRPIDKPLLYEVTRKIMMEISRLSGKSYLY